MIAKLFGRRSVLSGDDKDIVELILDPPGEGLPLLTTRDEIILANLTQELSRLIPGVTNEFKTILARGVINSYQRGIQLWDLQNVAIEQASQEGFVATDEDLNDPNFRRQVLQMVQGVTKEAAPQS